MPTVFLRTSCAPETPEVYISSLSFHHSPKREARWSGEHFHVPEEEGKTQRRHVPWPGPRNLSVESLGFESGQSDPRGLAHQDLSIPAGAPLPLVISDLWVTAKCLFVYMFILPPPEEVRWERNFCLSLLCVPVPGTQYTQCIFIYPWWVNGGRQRSLPAKTSGLKFKITLEKDHVAGSHCLIPSVEPLQTSFHSE